MAAVTSEVSAPRRLLSELSGVARSREAVIVVAFLAVVAATTARNPAFVFSSDGWRDLLISPSILILIAAGQAMVVITRNIDLSVGSILGLTAYLAGRLLTDIPGIPIVAVFVIGTLAGVGLGLINAILIARFRLPALVVTLGTLYVFRGIDVLWAGATRIFPKDLPQEFLDLGTGQLMTIPYLTIIALVVVTGVWWYLKNTRAGRESYAVGSDPLAAVLHGLPSSRRIMVALVASGALAGFAGVLYLARYASADSQVGVGWELQSVAAVVVGGVAIFGGSGSVWGAAVGAVLLLTINRALPVVGVPDFWQRAVVGVLILAAIAADRYLLLRRARRPQTVRDTTSDRVAVND